MSTTQIIVTAVIFSIIALGMVFAAAKMAHAHAGLCPAHCGGINSVHFFGHRSWSEPDKIQRVKQLCGERGRQRIVDVIKSIEVRLDFTDAQLTKWITVTEALQAETDTVNFLCEKLFTKDNHDTTPARLELLETIMVTGIETINRIRPAVLELYQILSVEQQRQLDELLARRHHGYFM